MPRELLGESGVDSTSRRAVDGVQWDAALALDATRARQRIVTVALESHEDVDTISSDAASGIVREAEPVMHVSIRERDPDEGGNVKYRPELDTSGVNRDRSVWDQPVSRRAKAEWRAAYEEISHSCAHALFDVDDAAISEPGRALGVQLASEVRRDTSDQLPIAREQLRTTLSGRRLGLVENAIKGWHKRPK
jgi:hypothetical protein